MSRSFKKPYVKDNNTGMKKVAARMERRIVRQMLKPWRNRYLSTFEIGCNCTCDPFAEYNTCGPDHFGYEHPADYKTDYIEPLLPLRKQIVSSYDICDYKLYRPKDPAYYRK